MFDVTHLICYNQGIKDPVIISTAEPFHISKVILFDTYQKFTDYFEENNFLISRTIDGFRIVLAYDGTLSGRVITLQPDYKKQLNQIMDDMEKFFRKERLDRFPKVYAKYIY